MTTVSRGFDAFAWDVVVAAALAISATVYAIGLVRLWRRAGAARGVRTMNVLAFAGGLAAVIIALLSPLDALSDILFSAHMGQHELLMLVAAPLLIMGRPWLTAAWALPAAWRGRILERFARQPARRVWRLATGPVTILLLHAAALWIWHVPALFERALAHETVHAFQHLCFFVTAALFWWALIQGRYGRAGYGAGALFVFMTALHSGILGALITLTGQVLYPLHGARSQAAGVDQLRDQQLAGLLMWIPGGVILIVLGLALFAAWLGEVERRARASARP
jgi:putative membrane protein